MIRVAVVYFLLFLTMSCHYGILIAFPLVSLMFILLVSCVVFFCLKKHGFVCFLLACVVCFGVFP